MGFETIEINLVEICYQKTLRACLAERLFPDTITTIRPDTESGKECSYW